MLVYSVVYARTGARHLTRAARRQVAIFPEGTCNNQRGLNVFKAGAFLPGVPVQPVVFRFPWRYMDPCYVRDGPNLAWLAIRLMSQVYNSVSG